LKQLSFFSSELWPETGPNGALLNGGKENDAGRPDKGAKIMATENFKQAGEIFQNAVEIEDPAKPERYLENACKMDQEL